jgi:hypothetical protein
MRYGEEADPISGVAGALADRELALNDWNKPFEPNLSFKGVRADRGGTTTPVTADKLQQLLNTLKEMRQFGPDWRLHGNIRN